MRIGLHGQLVRGNAWPGTIRPMTVALGVLLSVVALLSAGVVFAMFVWAARKDGEEDRALQRRLGIRRRTRIGR